MPPLTVLLTLWATTLCASQAISENCSHTAASHEVSDSMSLLQFTKQHIAGDSIGSVERIGNNSSPCSLSADHILLFGGYTTDGKGLDGQQFPLDKVFALSDTDSMWQECEALQMPTPRFGAQAMAHGSEIYITAGIMNRSRTDQTIVVNLPQKKWSDGPSMSIARAFPAAAIVDDKIYVIGSQDPDAANSVEILNLATQQWQAGPSWPGPGSACASAVAHGHDIYVVGQMTGRVDVLNTVTGTWRAGPEMPAKRSCGAAELVGDKIYYFGGFSAKPPLWPYAQAVDGVYMLDTHTQEWSELPSMPVPAAAQPSAVLGTAIYIIGGESQHMHPLNTVSIFDTTTHQWRMGPPLPVNVSDGSAVKVLGI